MKMLAFALVLSLTPAAFAETKTFDGAGEYKMMSGEKGSYKIKTVIEPVANDKMKLTDTLTIEREGEQPQTITMSFFKKMVANGFYEVLDANDAKIGSGYCFMHEGRRGRAKKVCQSSFETQGVKVQETVMLRGKRLLRTGSKVHDGKVLAWKSAQRLERAPRRP